MNKRIIILFIIISLLIALICVVFFLKSYKNSNMDDFKNDEIKSNLTKFNVVDDESMYFTVKRSIQNFIAKIKANDSKAVLQMLDNNYIIDNSINEENVLKKIETIFYGQEISIKKILTSGNETEDIRTYIVIGETRKKDDNKIGRKEKVMKIIINIQNMTFSIIPEIPEEGFNE